MQHPYRLDPKPLGLGGQAEVLRATHRETGEVVALKRCLYSVGTPRERFRREIETHRLLKSNHIMPILDADADFTWYTMPLAECDLNGMRGADDLPIANALHQVSLGIADAHEAGILHRDIKPGNMLRLPATPTTPARWVVSDYGLARKDLDLISMQLTVTDQMLGTMLFAAPEAWDDSHRMTRAADICSLGRVAAWATSSSIIKPVAPVESDRAVWRHFVEVTTAPDPLDRPSISVVVTMLAAMRMGSDPHDYRSSRKELSGAICWRCGSMLYLGSSECPVCGLLYEID